MIPKTPMLILLLLLLYVSEVHAEPLTAVDAFEVVVLGCILFYADIISDAISLCRFWRRGQKTFFAVNVSGILINMLCCTAFPYVVTGMPNLYECFLGFTQLHVLMSTIWILRRGQKVNGDAAFEVAIFRVFEFVEATLSFAVQGYTLVSDTELSSSDEMQLRISVAISVCSLANVLVMLEKESSRACQTPVVKSLASLDFMIFFMHRLSEVILSFGSLFLFLLATGPCGGCIVIFAYGAVNLFFNVRWLVAGGEFLKSSWNNRMWFLGMNATMLVLQTFYYCAPLGGKANSMFAAPALPAFLLRMTGTLLMFVYLVKQAGSMQALLGVWLPYTDSAMLLAYAVCIATVVYSCSFLLILWKYSRPVYQSLE